MTTNNSPRVSGTEAKGFFQSLLDFEFKNFITIQFAKVIYILAIALGILCWGFALIASLYTMADDFGAGLFGFFGSLILGGIMFILYIVAVRLQIEFVVSMIRTAQNTGELADLERAKQNQGGYGSYGQA